MDGKMKQRRIKEFDLLTHILEDLKMPTHVVVYKTSDEDGDVVKVEAVWRVPDDENVAEERTYAIQGYTVETNGF